MLWNILHNKQNINWIKYLQLKGKHSRQCLSFSCGTQGSLFYINTVSPLMNFRSHSGLTCFYVNVVWAIPKYTILWTRFGIKIWEINGATRFEVTGLILDWSKNISPVFTPRELSTLSRTSNPIPKNWDQLNKEKCL